LSLLAVVRPLKMSATWGEHVGHEKNVIFEYILISWLRLWCLFRWIHFALRHSFLRRDGILFKPAVAPPPGVCFATYILFNKFFYSDYRLTNNKKF